MSIRNWPGFFQWIKSTGFEPTTIVDVGVATDTEELYRHFPNSKYIFVEPVAEFESHLQHLCEKYNGNYILAAAGEENGTMNFEVAADLGASSFYRFREADDPEFSKMIGTEAQISRPVPVYTLDAIWEAFDGQGPSILKVDVQGGEMSVLKGAQNCLENFEIIILEVSFFEQYYNQPLFADYVTYLNSRGYVIIDFIQAGYADTGLLHQMDAVFAKIDGRFRQEQRACTNYERLQHHNNYKGVTRKD